jgi:sialic acid synthase SpsE
MIKPNFIEIAGHRIGPGYPPFIVAELSANHNGDLHRAVKIVEMAKECGAHAVKLQTYTQDTLTIDSDKDDFIIKDGLWTGRSLYDLYSEAHMPWEWHDPLFKKASVLLYSVPLSITLRSIFWRIWVLRHTR